METATLDSLRRQLTDRQSRLRGTIAQAEPAGDLIRLLQQVDAALARIDTGNYARCLVCEESVGEAELLRNPLLEYCLCDFTPKQQRALEHDLSLARRIQTALLPDPDLSANGWEAAYVYEPAGVVSGDYCDLWMRPDDGSAVYFAVGDVSGKGVASSLLMTHLQAAFRSLLGTGMPLGALVERVNGQLLQSGISTHYATLACGRLSEDGAVEIVNAGHCPPIIVRSGEIETVEPTGIPVGIMVDKPYEVHRLHLREGESMVLYTDGLTEARAPGGEEYGAKRLEHLLAQRVSGALPRDTLRQIRTDLIAFLNASPQTDDLTILVVRRASR